MTTRETPTQRLARSGWLHPTGQVAACERPDLRPLLARNASLAEPAWKLLLSEPGLSAAGAAALVARAATPEQGRWVIDRGERRVTVLTALARTGHVDGPALAALVAADADLAAKVLDRVQTPDRRASGTAPMGTAAAPTMWETARVHSWVAPKHVSSTRWHVRTREAGHLLTVRLGDDLSAWQTLFALADDHTGTFAQLIGACRRLAA